MQRVVFVKRRGPIEQADATDGAPEDFVVVRCGRQGAREGEEGIAAVTPADLQRLAAPAQGPGRVGGTGERVPLASLRTGVHPVALHDRVHIRGFSSGPRQ